MLDRFRLLLFIAASTLCAAPLSVDAGNPHYYFFRGKPTLLITSAEHYGAMINKDFDYVVYLDRLHAYGLNYTRIYPGAMFEPTGKFMTGNTLGPRPRSLVVPWARSDKPGYITGGNLFDLNRWDPEYFARLKDFLSKAAERGIVVEICFFNSQYSDTWPISPLYHENNIQGVGDCDWRDAQTLKHADVVQREDEYVRKLTQEVNSFDNVVLEICDEAAGIGTGVTGAGAWVGHLVDTVKAAERDLPNRHLIAQEIEGPRGGAMDFSADARVPVIVAQYVWSGDISEAGGDPGGMSALDDRYSLNKPIEMNETDYFPLGYRGDKIADSRVEAWEFMVGGGAGFNQLSGLYTPQDPAGNTPDNEKLLSALRNLRTFLEGFEFVKMRPDRRFVAAGIPAGVFWRGLSEPGRQYALYLHHSSRADSYQVKPGNYQETLTLELPAGSYEAEWVDPASGRVTGVKRIVSAGGKVDLATPAYSVDIALRIKQ